MYFGYHFRSNITVFAHPMASVLKAIYSIGNHFKRTKLVR
jgi:hypothetical protein